MSDGELQEGQIWEALQVSVFYELENLWAIVDVNESSLNLHDQKATRDGLSIKYGEVREHQIRSCVNIDEKSNSIDLQ